MTCTLYSCPCLGPSCRSHSFHPLSSLYFCETCDTILCPRCVSEEILSYFCPNCMFEVPTASVRSEKNRCARNCFSCPLCENTLAVVQGRDEHEWGLQCNVCRWDSFETMTWDKPTGLGMKALKHEDSSIEHLEFDNLKSVWMSHLKVLNAESEASANYKSLLPSSSAPSANRLRHRSRKIPRPADQEVRNFKHEFLPSSTVAIESEDQSLQRVSSACKLEDITHTSKRLRSTFKSDLNPELLGPERIHLATKILKRCFQCRGVVVKPDPKASSAKFKVKTLARTYLPRISVSRNSKEAEWTAGKSHLLKVEVLNPLFDVITVSFDMVSHNLDGIRIHLPDFETEIGACSDGHEISSNNQFPTSRSQNNKTELIQNEHNLAIFNFLVDISQDFTGNNVLFDINVTYTYRNLLGAENGAEDDLTGEIKPFTFMVRFDCGNVDRSDLKVGEDGANQMEQKDALIA